MQYLIPILVLFNCLIIQGIRDWRISGKVTDYGQNVTLFCNVPNCCPETSGWYKWNSKHDKLLIDIKSGYLSYKYGGKVAQDGFTLVIQNLTRNDLNVWYSCIYASRIGERKYLQEEDVFVFEPNTTKESTAKNKTVCQQLRLSSIDFSSHVPECTTTGEYKTRQCEGRRRYKTCWCVDQNGRQILGSQTIEPEVPDCDGGFPSWSLTLNPFFLGKMFDLTCSMSAMGRKDDIQSKQDGNININVLDGEPVNDINQLGKRQTFKRMYILTTSVYDNDGVNIQYECGHGNTRYAHVLNMTIESYEYIDNANNFHQLVNHEDLFSIAFRNYTQIPQCSVVYGQADYSKELQSTFDSRSQAYRIYLPGIAIKSKCPKTLKVTCNIGERRIVNTLQPDNADCLHTTLTQTEGLQEQDKDQTIGIVGLVIFMIIFVAVVGSCIVYIVIMECKRVFKRYSKLPSRQT